MSDVIAEFSAAMHSAGIVVREPVIADGTVHRYHVEGDRKGSRNAWAVLHLDDRPAGAFGCHKRMIDMTWTAEGTAPLSDAERKALAARAKEEKAKREAERAERHAAAAARANAIWDAAAPATEHPYLARKRVSSHGLRVAPEWVKEWTDPNTGEIRDKRIKNALLIPIRNARKQIVSLQAIFPDRENALQRDKDYLSDGEKEGCWFTIGKPVPHDGKGKDVVVICEGYATGASIHESSGFGVVVAFDANNLLPVAKEVRRILPEAVIIIAGDNDQWTEKPVKNPGALAARQAAAAVRGHAAIPEFLNVEAKPTDFNDLGVAEGADEIKRQITLCLAPPAPPALSTKCIQIVDNAAADAGETVLDDDPHDSRSFFRILGHDQKDIHVYSYEKNMTESHPADKWGSGQMIAVAPLEWWENEFKGTKSASDQWVKAAQNWLVRRAYERGFYDPDMRRGRGAWVDKGRVVFHFGNHLTVDGQRTELGRIDGSAYVYEQLARLPAAAVEPLSDEDGKRLLSIAHRFRWQRQTSGILLLGWCALAAVGGALKWRPHIWIAGGPGAGKSTVLKDFAAVLTGSAAKVYTGQTTEAAIRQELKFDALPVLFEEAEKHTDRDAMRVQQVIAMIRNASTESRARTVKGGAQGNSTSYLIRSMFALVSVAVGIEHQADWERISILTLRPKRLSNSGEKDAADSWDELRAVLYDLEKDETLPQRIMRRVLDLMPITLKNIETFARAGAKKFGSQREGDQYGALMAGAWSLVSRKLVTAEEAAKVFDRYDWSDYLENAEEEGSNRALSAVLQTLIRGPRGESLSVYELICAVVKWKGAINIEADAADALLRRHGLAVRYEGSTVMEGLLLVGAEPRELLRLLEGTPFHSDLRGQLLNARGAKRFEKMVSFNTLKQRAIAIPLSTILQDEERQTAPVRSPGEDDIPF